MDDLVTLAGTANEQHDIAGKAHQESVQREIALAEENERLRQVIVNIQTSLDDANCTPGAQSATRFGRGQKELTTVVD
ncbi:hypothetical protein BLL52_4138 [Rhodoferax antarcticus ANT.BR]|uniref:Uncharacterized protein n=1 Tax=Rhodoferax antarcticus ANT.BR TaxID=1111071 RepID=A0A1Q8Y908_9BURK|nr:hypothetical protein BLL52_4138 [Rhodoferax antarcticus ANT.BR]